MVRGQWANLARMPGYIFFVLRMPAYTFSKDILGFLMTTCFLSKNNTNCNVCKLRVMLPLKVDLFVIFCLNVYFCKMVFCAIHHTCKVG